RVGNDDRAFEPGLAEALLLVELREALRQGALGRALHARIERREDAQPLGAQVRLVVIAPQLPVYELHESGVGRRAGRRARGDAERRAPGLRILLEAERALLLRLAQHEISPLERARRVPARIVDRRTLHQRYQHRRLRRRQVLHLLAEIELRGEADAVDGAVAVLAEVDLVEVGLEDLLLAVMELEQHRHHELGELARQRALRRAEAVLRELLRDGAAALHALRAEREHRARERARVEAVV